MKKRSYIAITIITASLTFGSLAVGAAAKHMHHKKHNQQNSGHDQADNCYFGWNDYCGNEVSEVAPVE